MGELSNFQVGQTVELQDGQLGTVQFVGQTQFAAGAWVGVVLDNATGKNDGSVHGQRYFDCPPGYGMFVRPAVPKILDQPTPKANGRIQPSTNGEGHRSRSSIAAGKGRRESVLDLAGPKRQSINAGSPTQGLKGSITGRVLRSPTKDPTKHLGSTTSSGNSTPQSVPSSAFQKPSTSGFRTARPSMGPPSAPSSNVRPPRQSTTGVLNSSTRPNSITSASSRASSNRFSTRPETKPRLSSISGESHASAGSRYHSPVQSLEPEALSPPVTDLVGETSANEVQISQSQDSLHSHENGSVKVNASRTRSPLSKAQKIFPSNHPLARETEDLKTKLRVMEKKRMEDREKLKTLERVQGERDKLEGIIQKLQSRYQPQQQEAADLRKQLREMDAKVEVLEKQQAENDTTVEVATLDREMAEETAESLRNELDALKQSHEELRLEVEVLQEENQELGTEMSPEEKTSKGWLQMERSNERLREALMRLRDVTQEQEADLREQIVELERDLHRLEGAKEEQTRLEAALMESESAVAELRQQLDAALGAEEMIEELTEKNLALNEQVDNLKASVEDLESLKELNDELELNHTENAKQMQEEIDHSEALLAEQVRRATTQDQTIRDLEYTLNRFRELVANMQSDLEDMKTSQQLTEAEATDLNSRSRAMMDLNLRLQASASKAQVKAIDLELGRLEAQESAEHLSIVQLFLPDSFKKERNSVGAYLRCKRIRFKADLLYGYVKEKASRPPAPGHENDVYMCCDVMDKITVVSNTCDRLEKSVRSSNLEEFRRQEGALFDLEPVERAFNGWIEASKKDELKEEHCATELSRSIALLNHLAEVHITDSLDRYADDIHARALIMQSQLESTLMALSHTKAVAEAKLTTPETQADDEDRDARDLSRKSELLISQLRSAKVIVGKVIRQINDLQSRSLTLDQTTLATVELSQTSIRDLSDSVRSFGHSITELLNEENQSNIATAHGLLLAMSTFDTPFSLLSNKVQIATANLQTFHNLTAGLNNTVDLTGPRHPPPWQLLADSLASETVALASRENEVSRLQDENRDKTTALAMRDKSLEELNVKLETLEKRASESSGRRERVRELENITEVAKERELDLVNTVNRLRSERNDLRVQRESWASKAGGQQGPSTAAAVLARPSETNSEASIARILSLEKEIETLQAAIRHLHSTSYSQTISSAWDFLGKPLIPQPLPQEQRAKLKQSEAKGVVSELLRLATDPANGVVRLKARRKDERLGWRPVKETCSWQFGRAKEEWEEWREWRDDLAERSKNMRIRGTVSGKVMI
ncbi:MAG: hypothetical protein LQ343_000446 [Gyalolechia ehrenbergii]|nr:MAG: hypothetical protein LQ343_000446 [Gyalolechia ehrenbergii]